LKLSLDYVVLPPWVIHAVVDFRNFHFRNLAPAIE
jgi:hypothetical protein